MIGRRLPPVHSPLSLGAVGAGLAAALFPSRARAAEQALEAWLQATYHPQGWRWTDSGTTALTLALRLASEEGRKPVALPAYGCYDLATACDGADVRVLLYDLDPATLGPDWASLEKALAAGAGVVVVAHLYGVPVDLDQVAAVAARFGATVVEDAAQGVGASWRGRPLGSHGALAVLSFGRGKGLTSGGGGALLVHDTRYLPRLPDLPAGGRGFLAVAKTLAQWLLARPALYAIPASLPFLGLGETVYRPPHPATGMAAAGFGVLGRTVRMIDREAAVRRERVTQAAQVLSTPLVATATAPSPGVAGYLRLPIIVTPQRRTNLLKEASGFGVQPGYPLPLSALGEPFVRRATAPGPLPGATSLSEGLVTAPVHSLARGMDLMVLIEVLRRYFPHP